MNQLISNTIRNVKGFFVETIPDFGLEETDHDTRAADPLFDQASLAPTATRNQQSNQEAVLNALARATENYFLENIAPLLRNVPSLRWQIKQMQIRETVDNMHLLSELNKLSPSILNAVSKAVLCKLPCSHAMDMSQYYGISIVPDKELVGRAVVMWASLGQEKIAMPFYFDDDIFEGREENPSTAGPDKPAVGNLADVLPSFHLRLIDDDGARDIVIPKFPAIIGSSSSADVRVNGQCVSGQHLVLNWDAVLQCVFLIDRSKHGTYLRSGRRLADGDRVNLLGDGYFTLTNQTNAPRFEYWHGAVPGQGTALLPPKVREAIPHFRSIPADKVRTSVSPVDAATAVVPAEKPIAKPLRATKLHSDLPSSTKIGRTGTAQATLLCEPGMPAQPRPLAWLQVRNAQQHIETVAIATLPFSIGREFVGAGFPIDESYVKVSRTHLQLLEQRGEGFGVNNESPQRPGQSNLTFGKKGAESRQFVWTPQPGNSNDGWRVLGSNRLDGESIEVRLLAADSMHGCRP